MIRLLLDNHMAKSVYQSRFIELNALWYKNMQRYVTSNQSALFSYTFTNPSSL